MSDWRAIPGETPIDPSHLKDRSITTRRELCQAEALNIRKAYVKYLAATPSKRLAPFDYAWFLRLHEEMYCDVWMWAGQPRRENLNLGVDWPHVPEQVIALTHDLSYWGESGMSLLEQATRLHYRAVWIHPFMNGNGRWARLLATSGLGFIRRRWLSGQNRPSARRAVFVMTISNRSKTPTRAISGRSWRSTRSTQSGERR
jgi:fido (protein-threonine AMPylation protein)